MPLTITLDSRTFRQVVLNTAGRTAGYDRVEVQVSTRPDFLFVPSPLTSMIPDATTGKVTVGNLNQANRYWIRARERVNASGAVLPWTAPLAAYTPLNIARDTIALPVMVQPAIIVVPEPVTWTNGAAMAGRPPSNLASDAPGEQFWIDLGAAGLSLDFETNGAPIDTVALLGTNAPAGLRWQLRSYNTAADRAGDLNLQSILHNPPVQLHASPNLPGRPSYHGLMRLPVPRSEPFWRILFSDGGDGLPPNSLFVATYGVVGLARTAKNIAADKVETPLDYGSIDRTRDGTPDRRYGLRGRKVDFEIALMTEAQWETQFADLRAIIGLTDPALVVPNTRSGAFLHDRILYGPLNSARVQNPFSPRFSQALSVDSLI